MKYYCKTISEGLAKKLKEKGMPMNIWQQGGFEFVEVLETRKEIFDDSTYEVAVRYEVPLYCEVFDWLMSEKGIHIRIESDWDIETQIVTELACNFYIEKVGMRPIYVDIQNWNEAAEAAIEKALELINGD